MRIAYDPAKNAKNRTKHGIGLAKAQHLEWDTAIVEPDTRRDYGEKRMIAYGYWGERLYVLVFTRRESGLRAISLRKANAREQRRYEKRRIH